jgi:hypothetical protein
MLPTTRRRAELTNLAHRLGVAPDRNERQALDWDAWVFLPTRGGVVRSLVGSASIFDNRNVKTWFSRSACVFMVSGFAIVAAAGPAAASLTGGCQASGTQLQTGKSYNAVTTNFAKIPRSGDVKWKGSVPVPATKRLAVGEVQVKFPFPVGDVEIGHWGKDGKKTGSNANQGTYRYDFPKVIAGIKVLVHGRDREPGGPTCAGSVVVQVAGTSPLAWASLALTIVMVLNLSLAIRARKVGP